MNVHSVTNRIEGVMVSVLASSVVDRGFEPRSEQVNFQWDDNDVRFVLDQHAEFGFDSANSLKQHSVYRHVAPLGHINLIPSQPLLNAACLAMKQ
jgi:hypothetical protein